MDKKITSILAYVGIVGGACGLLPGIGKLGMFLPLIIWCVAYFAGDKNGAKVHLNQSLILVVVGLIAGIIGAILGIIPVIKIVGKILNAVVWVATLVLGILGLISAIKGEDKELPVIGGIKILK